MVRRLNLIPALALLALGACAQEKNVDKHDHSSVGKVEAEANKDKPPPAAPQPSPANGTPATDRTGAGGQN